MKYYIGIASTFHDNALAIINSKGDIIFAEATERYLQNKRAFSATPDNFVRAQEIVETYCADGSDFVITKSWRDRFLRQLMIKYLFGYYDIELWAMKKFLKGLPSDVLSPYETKRDQIGLIGSNSIAGMNLAKAINIKKPDATISISSYRHHDTHASYACFTSPFKEGVCLIVDGSGEHEYYSIYNYEDGAMRLLFRKKRYASIGLYYMLLTTICGFRFDKGEQWKVMGLAPFGKKDQQVYDMLKTLFTIDQHHLRYSSYKQWVKVWKALSTVRRKPGQSPLEVADIAYTGQLVFSEFMTTFLKGVYRLGNSKNLIYSGGVALNSAFNGQITTNTPFENLYVPSAPGDDGNAIGAAMLSYVEDQSKKDLPLKSHTPFLGSSIKATDIQRYLRFSKLQHVYHLSKDIYKVAAQLLAEGKIIGWIQGRAEFGPRALGNRSILAHPGVADMKNKVNARVKFREPFRPFAPSILEEYGDQYFENYSYTPFMEKTLTYKPAVRNQLKAIVHEDYTGRLQSVSKTLNPKFHRLLTEFNALTGLPIILNTSFNVMGKPIAHSMDDLINVFLGTGMDALVVEDYLFLKEALPDHRKYEHSLEKQKQSAGNHEPVAVGST